MDDDFDLFRGHVLDFLDLDLALVLGLEDAVNQHVGGLPIRDFRDGDGGFVHLLDPRTDLDLAAPAAIIVFGAVRKAPRREVRIDVVGLSLEDGDGRVDEFVEIVRQDFRGHADGDAFGPLGQQQREAHRQFGRLLVAAVVGSHPMGQFRVENHLLGKARQPRLDVTCGGVRVAGEDVAPVSLAVHGEAFLPELDEGAEDGRISVRMVLHGLSDDVRHLRVAPVVHLVHRMQHPSLDRLEPVHDVRHRPLQDHVGSVVQEPVLEHAGELELPAVIPQQAGELAAVRRRLVHQLLFLLLGLFRLLFNIVPFFAHNDYFRIRIRNGGAPCGIPASRGPLSQRSTGTPSSGRNPPSPAGPGSPLSSASRRPCR